MAKQGNSSFYSELAGAMRDLIEDLDAGASLTMREVEVPDRPAAMTPEQIQSLRERLGVSQRVFARLLNVADQTVHAWEQGRNQPTGATLRLLQIVQADPGVLADLLRPRREAS